LSYIFTKSLKIHIFIADKMIIG